jgi:hypothetical protein
MGNSNNIIQNIPEDLTKSSNEQLQLIIETAIINNPWNSDDKYSNEIAHKSLKRTVDEMKERGYRPITPHEYRFELQNSNNKIMLWIKDECCSSWTDDDTETSRSLPTSYSEITEITDDLFGDSSSYFSSQSRVDTKLVTEEWPTCNVYEFED